ncbi:hypothetical protein [Cyanothece sp. BG0011]|uniref:hypothetical protein n=1 Tax=Cyanothece sp. BG0011 TaxID=2082950 RepID=UPI000D1FD217|nr:hypothetical protein [Cyanothece sp. BG0011]
MTVSTIGRVPIFHPGSLLDPYIKDNDALIEPAEDFTISINYIPYQLYSKYKSHYKAGEFDNNYFAIMSQMGIGDVETPVLKAHYLSHIDQMTQDLETVWAENVAVVEDFLKNFSKNQESERIYLSFSSFCQGLGHSSLEEVTGALREVIGYVGAAFPSLVPYTTLGRVALEGVNNIVKTILEPRFQPQVKTTTFAFYPTTKDEAVPIGEAPLQTGSYAFFFETVELDNLWMDNKGLVSSTNGEEVSPYIVINIKKGIDLAPGQIEQNLATEVLETYDRLSGYPLTNKRGSITYFEGLKQLGKTIRTATAVERYFDLRSKGTSVSPAEAKRLEKLSAYLKETLGEDFP